MNDDANQPVKVIDLLWLNPGATIDQAKGYYLDLLGPMVRKHGGTPLLAGFRVEATMNGELKPDMIGGFEFPSPAALQALFRDPDYQKIVPIRNTVFDMAKHTLFKVTSLR